MSFEHLYLEHRTVIDQAIAAICRRHRLSTAEAEDFGGSVRLHLIEDDYAVLRKFEGRSSIKSYLFAVIAHLAQDWRNATWGKWRHSAEAKRLGPLAMDLERLVVRDGLSVDEARETLRTRGQIDHSADALAALLQRLPGRLPRRFVTDEALVDYPAQAPAPDASLAQHDAGRAAHHAACALGAALSNLGAQDRLIIKMRFLDDFSIAEIARVLGLEQKPLYRRIERLLTELRNTLQQAGLTSTELADVLAAGGFDRATADDADTQRKLWGDVRPLEKDAGKTSVQTTRIP